MTFLPRLPNSGSLQSRYLLPSLALLFGLLTCPLPSSAQAQAPSNVPAAVQGLVPRPGGSFTTQELAVRSEVVAVGEVAGVQSEWTADKRRIVTRATVRVDEYLKGGGGQSSITLVYPGGEVGKVGELYSHTVSFRDHESVVVFAKRDREGSFRVMGGDQGKMTIRRDASTGKSMVSATMSVDELKSRVKAFLKDTGNK